MLELFVVLGARSGVPVLLGFALGLTLAVGGVGRTFGGGVERATTDVHPLVDDDGAVAVGAAIPG